jgi:hypothetical protein
MMKASAIRKIRKPGCDNRTQFGSRLRALRHGPCANFRYALRDGWTTMQPENADSSGISTLEEPALFEEPKRANAT